MGAYQACSGSGWLVLSNWQNSNTTLDIGAKVHVNEWNHNAVTTALRLDFVDYTSSLLVFTWQKWSSVTVSCALWHMFCQTDAFLPKVYAFDVIGTLPLSVTAISTCQVRILSRWWHHKDDVSLLLERFQVTSTFRLRRRRPTKNASHSKDLYHTYLP